MKKKLTSAFDKAGTDIAWCPGCGNFQILNALKLALSELKIEPTKLVTIYKKSKKPLYQRQHHYERIL